MKQSKLTSWSNSKSKTTSNSTVTDVIEIPDDDDDLLLAVGVDQNKPDNIPSTSSSHSIMHSSKPKIEVLPGFDVDSGNNWIYPTNYPLRDYQYNITQKALFKNTLVTLPTGLGKTFIAAVVMYNFFRWYPNGKVVFMAPTKPLVAQQEEACYNVTGIPRDTTIRLTGTMNPDKRRQVWQSKRVFFLTPQVLQNDLNRETCCANDIVCLVVDEAHRALGNHAYCQVIRGLCNYTRNFRVLALSATPGDDIQNVQKVIANLLISDVEIRSEESIDIRPYTHKRSIQKIVVPLSEELKAIKAKFLTILGDVIERLHRQQVLYSNQVERLSKYQILKAREQFRKGTSGFSTQRGSIEGDFALAISLYHAYELLLQQGMKSFYQFAKGIVDNSKSTSKVRGNLAKNRIFIEIMDELNFKFNRSYNSQLTPKSKATNVQFLLNSHPKLSKLRDIVIGHFENFIVPDSNSGQSSLKTRIMIFAQYRDSVVEITDLLQHYSPTVKVMSFTGQATSGGKSSRGLSQKEQLKVIQDFRRGGYNTLVSTCVGEEGLDIGDVDLIICYDSNTSPIRLVQRMGRTGRKRRGRVVLLVTEGKEEQLQSKTENKKKSIHRAIRDSVNSFQLYQHNPRMVPAHLKPQPYKTELTVKKLDDDEQDITKSTHSNDNILAYLKKGSTGKGTNKKDAWYLNDEEFSYWNDNFKVLTSSNSQAYTIAFDDLPHYSSYEKVLLPHHKIEHTQRTKDLIEISSFCEALGHNNSMLENYDMEMTAFLDKSDIKTDIALNANSGNEQLRKQHIIQEFVATTSLDSKDYQSRNKRTRRNKYSRFLDDDDDSDNDNEVTCTGTHLRSTEMSKSQIPVLHSDSDDNVNNDTHERNNEQNEILSDLASNDLPDEVRNFKDMRNTSKILSQWYNNLSAAVTDCNKIPVNGGNNYMNIDDNPFKELQTKNNPPGFDDDVSDELMSSLPEVEFISKKQEWLDVKERISDDNVVICPPPPVDYELLNKIGDDQIDCFNSIRTKEVEDKLTALHESGNQGDTTSLHQKIKQVGASKSDNESSINLFDDDIDDSLLLCATESDINAKDRNVQSNHSYQPITKGSKKGQVSPIVESISSIVQRQQSPSKSDEMTKSRMKLNSTHARNSGHMDNSKTPYESILGSFQDDDIEILSAVTPQLCKPDRTPINEGKGTMHDHSNSNTIKGSQKLNSTPFNVKVSNNNRCAADNKATFVTRNQRKRTLFKDGSSNGVLDRNQSKTQTTSSANRNQKKDIAKNFIDDEAEVSSQHISQFDSDEYEYEFSGAINDSFINDNSQPTPYCDKQADTSPGSMLAVYQQSLFSPNINCRKSSKLKFQASHRLRSVLNKENNPLPTPTKVKKYLYDRNDGDPKTGSDCSSDYEYNSFCVENEDDAIEYLTQAENVLDDLESKLIAKCSRKRKSRNLSNLEDESIIMDNSGNVDISPETNIPRSVDGHNASKESLQSDVNNGICIGISKRRKRKSVLDDSWNSVEETVDALAPTVSKFNVDEDKGCATSATKDSEYLRNLKSDKVEECATSSLNCDEYLNKMKFNYIDECPVLPVTNEDQEIGNFNLELNDWIDDDDVLAMVDSNNVAPTNVIEITDRSKSLVTVPLDEEIVNEAVPDFSLGIDIPLTDNTKPFSNKREFTKVTIGDQSHKMDNNNKISISVKPKQEPNVKNFEAPNSLYSLSSDTKKSNNELSILVDTRELSSNSQTITELRFKHRVKTEVCSLKCCSYVLSTRMGVERQLLSSLVGGSNDKFVDRIRHMCGLYDRSCLIIEKDRSKNVDDSKTNTQFITKYLCITYTSLALSRVKLLFSESQEHTANLLVQLAAIECKKNYKIDFPLKPVREKEQLFKIMMSIPSVSYILALDTCAKFNSLTEFIDKTPKELEKMFAKAISLTRAENIYSHFHHSYDPVLQGLKTTR